jgi:ATP synthase F1 epsilon subunit
MSENFAVEIISPDNSILKSEANEVTIPSYEGLMGILKDHIPLITFLRPGLIVVKKNNEEKIFFVEEGTVEFANNNLLILSSSVQNLEDLDAQSIDTIVKESQEKIENPEINDKEKYILSYKINTLKELN